MVLEISHGYPENALLYHISMKYSTIFINNFQHFPFFFFLGINALATNTVEDILRRPLRSLEEKTITFITKVFVLVYGAIIISLSYLAKSFQGPVTQMANSIFAALGSPLLGIYLMGGAVPWANKFGAIAGLAISLTFNIWMSVGHLVQNEVTPILSSPGTEGCDVWQGISIPTDQQGEAKTNSKIVNTTGVFRIEYETLLNKSNKINAKDIKRTYNEDFFIYSISYEWYSFLGLIICIAVGLIVSYVTNSIAYCTRQEVRDLNDTNADAKYIFPVLVKLWGLKEPSTLFETTSLLMTAASEKRYNIKGEPSFKTKNSTNVQPSYQLLKTRITKFE